MKLTEKKKKYLAAGGGLVICVLLLAAIGMQFSIEPAGEDIMPEESQETTESVIDPDDGERNSEESESKETEIVIHPNTIEETETDPEVDSRPAQTDQPEQSIQPEATKPAEPEEAVKIDPTKKPDGTKVETPPKAEDHGSVVTPTEEVNEPEQPQAGDEQDGKVYFPGFGYVEDSGANQENYAEDMYENGNKIGVMD